MPLPTPCSFLDLRTGLRSVYSTHGWDLVLSYDVNKLDGIWAQKWRSPSAIVQREMSVKRSGWFRTDTFTVDFRSPSVRLGIINETAVATLQMEVQVNFKSSVPKLPLPPTNGQERAMFIVQCVIGQNGISGQCLDDDVAVDAMRQAGSQNSLWFELCADRSRLKERGASVLQLDLDEAISPWEITMKTEWPGGEFDSLFGDLGATLLCWIKESGISTIHCVHETSSMARPAIATTEDFWSPKYFAIGASGRACPMSPGIISLYVNVRGSGTLPNPTPPAADNWKLCPVPEQRTLSMLIDRRLLRRSVFVPALTTGNSYTNARAPEWVDTIQGFQFLIYPGPRLFTSTAKKWKNDQEFDPEPRFELDLDLGDAPHTVTIDEEGKLSFAWSAQNIANTMAELYVEMNKEYPPPGVNEDARLWFPQSAIEELDFKVYRKNVWTFLDNGYFSKEKRRGDRPMLIGYPRFTLKVPDIPLAAAHALTGLECSATTISVCGGAERVSCPYDILVIGDLVQPSVVPERPPVSPVMPEPVYPAVPSSPTPVKSYFDPIFTDQGFLFMFLKTAATQSPDILRQLCKNRLAFPTSDRDPVLHAISPGPGFDERLIAGAYEIDAPDELNMHMIFIDTISTPPGVWLNNYKMEEVVVERSANHHLSFQMPDSQSRFALKFEFPLFNPNKPITFSGTITDPGHETSVVTGFQVVESRYYPVVQGVVGWDTVTWLASVYCLFGLTVWMCYNSKDVIENEDAVLDIQERAGKCLFSFDERLRLMTLKK